MIYISRAWNKIYQNLFTIHKEKEIISSNYFAIKLIYNNNNNNNLCKKLNIHSISIDMWYMYRILKSIYKNIDLLR